MNRHFCPSPSRASRLLIAALAALPIVVLLPSGVGQATTSVANAPRTSDALHPGSMARRSMLRPRNVRPRPNFVPYCGSHSPNSRRCISLELAAIRHARAVQGFPARRMVLPRNYRRLTYARQIFVLTNLERVDRGLRPFHGLTPALNRRARRGATKFDDPTVNDRVMRRLGLRRWSSVWAEDLGPLAADYDWMYADGFTSYGPRIIDCDHPHAKGCWAHRDSILEHLHGRTLVAGAGSAYACALSVAVVMSATRVRSDRFAYTWRRAVHAGAGHRVTTPLHDHAHRVA